MLVAALARYIKERRKERKIEKKKSNRRRRRSKGYFRRCNIDWHRVQPFLSNYTVETPGMKVKEEEKKERRRREVRG